MKGAVAAGHPITSGAAARILESGGNAFDAVLAAGFTSVVAEPTLTSFGGGGFLLAHIGHSREDILFDFFVNTPGKGRKESEPPSMTPVDIKFPGCSQTFHTGYASVAVPGTLKGFLHIHERLGTLPLDDILEPAMELLQEGVVVNERQAIFLSLLEPIMTSSRYGSGVFKPSGRYAQTGDVIHNPDLAEFFDRLLKGEADIYTGNYAKRLICAMEENNGLVTEDDLSHYHVVERAPLRVRFRDREILTNPPPSLGGLKLKLTLALLGQLDTGSAVKSPVKFWMTLAEVMKEVYQLNVVEDTMESSGIDGLLRKIAKSAGSRLSISTKGTTHISIIDEQGNAASMTTSNGSGSGCFVPGSGIMLNNMMGEDDLHPDGFFSSPAGRRVSSMMLPTIVTHNGEVEYVMGSGGSKRIRSAVLQVILNLIDSGMPVNEAVESPRMHYEDGILHVEPGIPERVLLKLQKYYDLRQWPVRDMYFGGVHCAAHDMQGSGDSRRGGSFVVLQ